MHLGLCFLSQWHLTFPASAGCFCGAVQVSYSRTFALCSSLMCGILAVKMSDDVTIHTYSRWYRQRLDMDAAQLTVYMEVHDMYRAIYAWTFVRRNVSGGFCFVLGGLGEEHKHVPRLWYGTHVAFPLYCWRPAIGLSICGSIADRYHTG